MDNDHGDYALCMVFDGKAGFVCCMLNVDLLHANILTKSPYFWCTGLCRPGLFLGT